MKIAFAAIAVALVAMTPASADPITERKALMKERSVQLRVLAPMAQGKVPFDADAAATALQKLADNAKATDVAALWPEGSHEGDTDSAASVWEDLAGYVTANEKYLVDVEAAVAAAPANISSFQAAFGPVAAHCKSCHEVYRR